MLGYEIINLGNESIEPRDGIFCPTGFGCAVGVGCVAGLGCDTGSGCDNENTECGNTGCNDCMCYFDIGCNPSCGVEKIGPVRK